MEKFKSDYSIVVSASADLPENTAALELQKYLYKSTGKVYPVFNDTVEKFTPEILIGFGVRGQNFPDINRNELGEEGFVLKPLLNGDFLIAGNTERAVFYGVYTFLEYAVGFKAYTSSVEKWETLTNPVFPEKEIIQKADFEYRDAFFTCAFNPEFAVKNKLNLNKAYIPKHLGGGKKYYSFGHSLDLLLPAGEYFSSHPEYYALFNGERTPLQPCLTNPKVFEIVRNNLIKQIKDNPDCEIFSVAQNDSDVFCECENCKKIHKKEGSASGVYISFVNKLAKSIKKDYPNVLIHTLAYRHTRFAPKTVVPEDNVIIRLCNIECDWSKPFEVLEKEGNEQVSEFVNNLKEWGKITKRLYVWDYAVNFRNYLLPFPNFYQMAENIRFMHKNGVTGILEQGNYAYNGGACLDELKAYLISKLAWNVNENPKQIIADFCSAVYGAGGKYIVEYIDLLTDAVKGHKMTLYDDANAPYFSTSLADKCAELFEKAKDLASSEEWERLDKENLAVDYLQIVLTEDKESRVKKTNEFTKKLHKYGITEISEKVALEDSLNFMRESRFANRRFAMFDYLRYIN